MNSPNSTNLKNKNKLKNQIVLLTMLDVILDFLSDWYLTLKALHIISVVSWMAGLLYLPRLFVYHCGAEVGSKQSETFKIMEYRLMNMIMVPAMLCSFLFGGLLFLVPGVLEGPIIWAYGKGVAIFLLLSSHSAMNKWREDFACDSNEKTHKFFRFANEVPTILMIIIVFLVVLKPF